MGSDRIGTKLKPHMGFRYQFSVPVSTYDPIIKSSSIFNFFHLAVWIIHHEKSPVRSDAYFPEWKPAFKRAQVSVVCVCQSILCSSSPA